MLYNPVTVAMNPAFSMLGASIPTIVLSGMAYYLAVRLILIPLKKGGYHRVDGELSRPILTTENTPGGIRVSL
jgi:hypothetical protein